MQTIQHVASRTRSRARRTSRVKIRPTIILKENVQGVQENLAIVIESDHQEVNVEDGSLEENGINREERQLVDQLKGEMEVDMYRKGRFTPREQRLIIDAVGQFLTVSEITYEQFLIILNETNVINTVLKKANFFKIMSKALPGRSPVSCYRFLRRNFNAKNRKGKWSEQQSKRLIKLVERYGHSWQIIAQKMGRTADNVYDKYRSLGSDNTKKRRSSPWQLREFIRLLLLVNARVQDKFLDESIREQRQHEIQHNARVSLVEKRSRYNSAHCVQPLIQLGMKYIKNNLRALNIEGIPWSAIAVKLERRSMNDCKNKFIQLFQYAIRTFAFEDMRIVEFVERQRVEEEHQIDWSRWEGEIGWSQAKNRFFVMRKMVSNKGAKYFEQLLQEIRSKILLKSKE